MQQHADVVTDLKGNAVKNAQVRVLLLDGTQATIYAANGGAPGANPIITDAAGRFAFYAPNGRYKTDVVINGKSYGGNPDILLYDPADDAQHADLADLAAPDGAELVGYGGRTLADKLGECVSATDAPYNARSDGTDATAAIQAALDYVGAHGGGVVNLPVGTFVCSGALSMPKKTTLRGSGRFATILQFSHTGDGIQSLWTINGNTAANVALEHCSVVNTNASNTGGGFVDVGGTFVDVHDVAFSGWKRNIIFDQTEVGTIDLCHLTQSLANAEGIWLVNGADHTAGGLTGFTNRITITRCHFNAVNTAGYNIVDDGGVNHVIRDCNLNAGLGALRAAGVFGLTMQGNECEVHVGNSVVLTNTTKSGAYVGPCHGIDISGGNTFVDNVSTHIQLDDARGGQICGNVTGQAVGGFIYFTNGDSNPACGLEISGNAKLVSGAPRTAAPFITAATFQFARVNQIRQGAMTYSTAAASTGAVTITPASMEFIKVGAWLVLQNDDGTNVETVSVTAVTGTTFSATLTKSHAANFIILGSVVSVP